MISIINPQLDTRYADVWGEYLPFALENWRPIIEAGCYVPRWYQAPTDALEIMALGDYSAFSVQIPPGSFILMILHSLQTSLDVGVTGSGKFSVQINDTNLGHEWFSQPIPDSLFYKTTQTGRVGHVLPKPYPVLAPGNFMVERWCTLAGSCELIFACAVPKAEAH